MVSVYPTPPAAHRQDFYQFAGMGDPLKMGLPGMHPLQPPPPTNVNGVNTGNVIDSGTGVVPEDPNKKVRKPYTITKSRESWTDQEHDKFLEALQLFDRDWKKIEAFVGSKTVIQIRSHAQKYFLKVQKSGTSEHVPPPRPKRKASHPYPQKAPKTAAPQATGQLHSSTLVEPKYIMRPDSLSVPGSTVSNPVVSPWTYNALPKANMLPISKDKDMGLAGATITHNYSSSSNESIPRIWPTNETSDQLKEKDEEPARVMPDFAQVYSFIGSIFDPNANDHLLRLRKMDPINMETVLMLMKNLSVNLMSPEFEDHRRLIASYGVGEEEHKQKAPNKTNLAWGLEHVV